jgi:hypothetical protein
VEKGVFLACMGVGAEKRETLGADISGRRVAEEGAAGMDIKGRALLTGTSPGRRGVGAPSPLVGEELSRVRGVDGS